ncbi:MAG: efflux RND transporter periplasmic adaptor subunit [Hyphomonadaceae bacterium]|nr:efflux RND transporter periplasmic adaptor subunit [Hyphomonadaceae bacterium]
MKVGRFGVAAVALAALALMVGAVLIKLLATPAAAPGGAGPGGGGPAPVVQVGTVASRGFSSEIQALGTAQANESVVLASKVADVIQALRFESGQRVARGQVLVVLASVEQQAELAEARAQLEADESERKRIEELAQRGFATTANLDVVRAAAARSKARVQALNARIAERTLRAPFAGVLGLRNASVGQFVQPGQEIVTLDDVSSIKLDFEAPETDLALVRKGVKLQAETAAFPGRTFSGSIAQVDSRVDPATRTVRARAILSNRDGALKPGMLLTVRLQADPRRNPAVPETALIERGDQALVYRVAQGPAGPTAEAAAIRIGRRQNGLVEVLEGVAVGDQIIVAGVNRVRPGQVVDPRAVAEDAIAAPGGGTPIERGN